MFEQIIIESEQKCKDKRKRICYTESIENDKGHRHEKDQE